MAKKSEQIYIPRMVNLDEDFWGDLMKENRRMNKMREQMNQHKMNSSEELVELAKEGLAQRVRIRNIS
jgi:hypothetical protein